MSKKQKRKLTENGIDIISTNSQYFPILLSVVNSKMSKISIFIVVLLAVNVSYINADWLSIGMKLWRNSTFFP